jgi:hypothetical protein
VDNSSSVASSLPPSVSSSSMRLPPQMLPLTEIVYEVVSVINNYLVTLKET